MKNIYKHIVSKRKTTISRIYINYGNGKILINKLNFKKYFKNNIYILYKINLFLKKINFFKKPIYNFIINIYGGGYNSQVESIIYGISKLLFLLNHKYKLYFKNSGFLRNDCRKVERKKYGKKKSRKSYQFSKR
ncbi:MAG: 30S ribosomal protein S9 [Candidatus Shikimatogenerans sp. Tder]|uniref:30S ribosomal protein S9 n=1 Tax=Candidatus Shikimatogenerans sp. Tder TaxID=3158566 RepID=A0AAU7QSD1_9FLAO